MNAPRETARQIDGIAEAAQAAEDEFPEVPYVATYLCRLLPEAL